MPESSREYLNILEDLYGSDGIKRDMMQNYLPTLNEEIQDALSSLSFPYSLEFDNNFDIIDDKDVEEEPSSIVKRKQIEMKPMSEDEAILQMELLGH